MPIPTNLGVKYARKVLTKFWEKAVAPEISNQDYEGDIKGGGADRLKILQFLNNVSLSDYEAGTAMTTETFLGDVESSLIVDQLKYSSFEIDNLKKFFAYVDDLDSNLIQNASDVLTETIDSYVLGFYSQVKAGHRVGSDFDSSDYITGVAAVTAITGAISINTTDTTGSGLPPTHIGPSLVGLGISFDLGINWYKISSFTDSDTFVCTDWNDSSYTGGTKAGANVIIEAVYPKTVTASTIYGDILDLATNLDDDKIPKGNRSLVIPPAIGNLLRQASEMILAVPEAYEKVVENGLLGHIGGFKIYESTQVAGNANDGFHCIASHKGFITFAHAYVESRVVISENNFAKKYQGLNAYGAVVTIERRKAGAEGFWILSGKGDDYGKAAE